MAELCDHLSRPVMGRAAGFHRHHARGELGEKGQNFTPFVNGFYSAPTGIALGVYTPPRMYGLTATYHF